MSNVVNLAEYRRRKEEQTELERDLDDLRHIHKMSREEIALLITHMFNDEMDMEITDDVDWKLDGALQITTWTVLPTPYQCPVKKKNLNRLLTL